MLILRIRQAEVALYDERLDEAFELCQSPRLRSHRRGQKLVSRLVEALVKRGHAHLSAGRPQLALTDCQKAERLGGNLPVVAELKSRASEALERRERSHHRHARALVAARGHIEAGRLAAGRQALADAGDESRAALLLRDLNDRLAMVESNLNTAQSAFDRGELDVAAAELVAARQVEAADPRVVDLCGRVCGAIRQRVASAVNDGRLDLADTFVRLLSKLDDRSVETEQFDRAIQQCRLAWESIDRSQPRRADEILRRLSALFPEARWIRDALQSVAAAEQALGALRGGPLGLLSSMRVAPGEQLTEIPTTPLAGSQRLPAPAPPQKPKPRDAVESDMLPSRFILQVDNAGSFVVVRQSLVTIGPLSSSRVPDVGLIAEPGAPVVTVERNEDDYFIRSSGPIAVNDRATTGKLLMRGDRVAISPRCRLTFNLPNAASTTATIDLTAGRFPRSDVRRVILLDRDLIVGPGNSVHARADHLPGNIVLLVRDGRLYVQADALVKVNGVPSNRTSPIPLGARVEVGNLSFVMTRG